uniref:Chorion-specific transcription factor GCMb-like n=1 Tax=Neolamprologus brichardi TaxID=32507 RepID=A0A3Q4H5V9_NEOBR
MSRAEEREEADCVCSVGMKLTWDINDPKLPQDTKQFDPFQEWTDGYVRYIYSGLPDNNELQLSSLEVINAKGVHDHPRPESKSETEARRSSVKRRVNSPPFTPKRRLIETQVALGPALLSCVEPTDRISFIEPNFPQHYPAFQSPEPYYNPHNALGESTPTLQKPANPRLYMSRPGYDFQGYLTSPSYPVTSDLCDPRLASDIPQNMAPVLGSSSSSSPSSAPLSSSSTSFDPQTKTPSGWKELLKNSAPYSDNHHYYSTEYPCRYASNNPGSPAALQTIITTTTKSCPKPSVGLPSYQPCTPSKPAGLPGCSSLLDDPSSSSYSTEVKVTEESGGVIKSLSFQPEPLQTKTERADGYDYRYSYPNTYRYDDY